MDFDPHHVNITVCSYLLFAAFLRFQLTVHAVCANFYLSFVLDDELCFSEFWRIILWILPVHYLVDEDKRREASPDLYAGTDHQEQSSGFMSQPAAIPSTSCVWSPGKHCNLFQKEPQIVISLDDRLCSKQIEPRKVSWPTTQWKWCTKSPTRGKTVQIPPTSWIKETRSLTHPPTHPHKYSLFIGLEKQMGKQQYLFI